MKFGLAPALPAVAPSSAPAPSPEASSVWMRTVVAPLAQNFVGGMGLAIVLMVLGLALWPDRGPQVGKASGMAGLVLFGLASAVRAFRDEFSMLVAAYAAGSLDATTAALQAENARLLTEIERLKTEGLVAHQWSSREAAERLAADYWRAIAAQQSTSGLLAREASMQRGLSRADWEHGVQFLKGAGLLERGELQAASEEATLAGIARHAAVSRVRVRAANGSMASL